MTREKNRIEEKEKRIVLPLEVEESKMNSEEQGKLFFNENVFLLEFPLKYLNLEHLMDI